MSCAVITSPDGYERRARRFPWGIQIEVWRRVETRTLPSESAQLSLGLLLADEDAGAIPQAPSNDERTLENLIEIGETTLEEPLPEESGADHQGRPGGDSNKEPV